MSERELNLFGALSDIGDDLILESGAFVGGTTAGAGATAATAATASAAVNMEHMFVIDEQAKPKRERRKKKGLAIWPILSGAVAAVAVVAVVGILVAVVGGAFGLVPWGQPDDTEPPVSDTVSGEPMETTAEEPTDASSDTETEAPTEEATEADTESDEDFHVKKNNYGGEFVILYCSDTFEKGCYFENTDRSPTYALGEAAYQRIKQTEDHLGVDIVAYSGGDSQSYAQQLTLSIGSGLDEYQMVFTHTYENVFSTMSANVFMDMGELESLDMNADYWSPKNNQALTVGGKQLIAYSDLLLPDGYVVGFNRTLVNGLFRDTELYTLVNDHGWTLEKMEQYVTAYKADNGDGKWDDEDTYGLSCYAWAPLMAFQTAADIRVLDNSGSRFELASMQNVNKIADLETYLTNLMGAESTYTYSPYTANQAAVRLNTGRTMFELTSLSELITYGDEAVDVGILPYPLYDRDQSAYRTLHMGGYVAVPSMVKRTDMVSDVIETLTYLSEPVQEAYLETVWEKANCGSLQDKEMLQLIRDSMTCELGLALSGVHARMKTIVFALPEHIVGGESSYASLVPFLWSSMESKVNRLLA